MRTPTPSVPASAPAARTPRSSTRVLDADALRRSSLTEFETLRAEQKDFGKQVAQARGDEKQALVAQAKQLSERVKAAQAAADEAQAALDALMWQIPNVVAEGVPVGGEDDYVVLREVGHRRDLTADGGRVRDHLEVAEGLRAVDMVRGAKVSGTRFYFLTGIGARLELALLNYAMDTAVAAGFTPDDHADSGAARGDGRHRLPRRARRRGVQAGGRRPVPGRHVRGGARRLPLRRDRRPLRRSAALRGMVGLLPPRGGLVRQGHPRHHPRAPVPQGRDVQLLHARRRGRRARPAARAGRSRCWRASSCRTA